MSETPVPDHLILVSQNMQEVRRLLEIHKFISGDEAGRKHKVEVLNKSAIVLTVACWESYIEMIAAQAFEILINEAETHDSFPMAVLHRISEPLRTSGDPRDVWKLAGAGWKKVLETHKERVIDKYIENFHTPEPSKVDTLFDSLLGLKTCSSQWTWKGMSNVQCISKLEQLLKLRHEIAHKVNAHKKISKDDVKDYGNFIFRLAAMVSNIVGTHVKAHTGKEPWGIRIQFLTDKGL